MKTVLIVDDEQVYLEALADALEHEGYRVLKASNATDALRIIEAESINLVTVDIMMPPGNGFARAASSHTTGVELCRELREKHPGLDVFCISVVSDRQTIRTIESLGARFLGKGETPLRTVLDMIRTRLTGVAYDSSRRGFPGN